LGRRKIERGTSVLASRVYTPVSNSARTADEVFHGVTEDGIRGSPNLSQSGGKEVPLSDVVYSYTNTCTSVNFSTAVLQLEFRGNFGAVKGFAGRRTTTELSTSGYVLPVGGDDFNGDVEPVY